MANAVWVMVPNYEGLYEVSDTGMVRGLDRQVKGKNERSKTVKGRVLSLKSNGQGYLKVTLCKNGDCCDHYVHRLVLAAFKPNTFQKCCGNHLNGVKHDNRIENLDWATPSENAQHAYDNELNLNSGAGHMFAVGVVDNQIGAEFPTIKEWADARGINYSTARNILSGYSSKKGINRTLIIKLEPKDKKKNK